MVAGAEVFHQSIPVLDVGYRCIAKEVAVAATAPSAASPPPPGAFHHVRASAAAVVESVAAEIAAAGAELDLRSSDAVSDISIESAGFEFVPSVRSGSFADIGPRRHMEDEHIRIDDLSAHLGSMIRCPTPSAFYGVFDGHGGPDAAAYIRKHAVRLFFEDADFLQTSQADDGFLEEVASSVRKAFLAADDALADDCSISSSSGTTALTALVLGRLLLVANAGDCRAVLCRKGEAVEMSQDHRPIRPSERRRVEESGGFFDDGYLNGDLSVTRALGDWYMKLPRGAPSPLIAEPEFERAVLTEDDEFLIIGCDGIWDVMTSQHAVRVVRRGLRRHNDPDKCARELVMEALRLHTCDNLTVIVVCFSPEHRDSLAAGLRCCSLSTEALCNLRSWLSDGGSS